MSELSAAAHSKRDAFLAAYAECGTVLGACAASGVGRSTHYLWLKEPEYAEKFRDATKIALDKLEAEARRRAIEGVRRLKFHKGDPLIDPATGQHYYEHEYSDTLLIFLLKAGDPSRFRDNVRHELTGANGGPIEIEAKRAAVVKLMEDEQASKALELLADHIAQNEHGDASTG